MEIRRLVRGLGRLVAGCSLLLGPLVAAAESARERPFFQDHPILQFIEQRLPASSTTVVPPDLDRGKQVVTDLELRSAFASLLDEFLAPPSTSASKAGDLIREVCRYRPAQAAQWIAVAVDAMLKHSLPGAERDLNEAVASAIAANPRLAGAVVRMAIRRILAGIDEGAFRAAGRLDRDAAARAAGRVVLTGIRSVKTGPQITDIVDQALDESLTEPANDFVIETMAAAFGGLKGVETVGMGPLAKMVFSKYGSSKLRAGIICAGLIKGGGAESVATIKDEAALSLPMAFAAYTNIVCNAYVTVSSAPQSAAFQVSRSIAVSTADYIPAAMIGAIVAAPQSAAEILQAGLNRDLVLHGRATTREIVEAAVMASESNAPELAAAAVDHGDPQEGNAAAQIAEGMALATPVARIGAALSAQIKAQDQSAATIQATVAGAVAGAVAAEKRRAMSAIAFAAAADPKFAGDVLDQMIVSAPRELQYAGVLGVLAARAGQARVLLERALKHADLEASQAAPMTAGGAVIMEIQSAPAGFFRSTRRRLNELGQGSPITADAIVLGVSLANPRGAPAVTAAAAVAGEAAAPRLLANAIQGDAGSVARIRVAVASATRVKGDPGNLFRDVRTRVSAMPGLAAEIVTGAMAAAPSLGPAIGHAAAVASPGSISQVVPRLFAFSPDGDSAETFAALTSGVMHGVIEAKLEPATEREVIVDAVAVSIRSVVALSRGQDAATSTVPQGDAIVAVVSAAAGAARGYALEIARVSARTARALSCPDADQGRIKNAVLAACPAAEGAKIADAIRVGIAEAELQVPAAGVKSLLDYAYDSLTERPMTSFRDL